MVVIDGRPLPGRRLDPYVTSVPGVQPTRNNSVMQTPILVIARSPQGGLHGCRARPGEARWLPNFKPLPSACAPRAPSIERGPQRTPGAQIQGGSFRPVPSCLARRIGASSAFEGGIGGIRETNP
jgi:hypothetical protein